MLTVEILSNLNKLIDSQEKDLLEQANEMISILTNLEIDPSLLYYFFIKENHNLNTLTQEEIDYLSPKYQIWKDLEVVSSTLASFCVKIRNYTMTITRKMWRKERNKALYKLYIYFFRKDFPKKPTEEEKRKILFISMKINNDLFNKKVEAKSFKEMIGKRLYNDLLPYDTYRLRTLKEIKEEYNSLSPETLSSFIENQDRPIRHLILWLKQPLSLIETMFGQQLIDNLNSRSNNQVKHLLSCVSPTTSQLSKLQSFTLNLPLITALLNSDHVISNSYFLWPLYQEFITIKIDDDILENKLQTQQKFINFLQENNSIKGKDFSELYYHELFKQRFAPSPLTSRTQAHQF